jgi:hypothetical protein
MSAAATPAVAPDPTRRSNGGRPRSRLDWSSGNPRARPAVFFGADRHDDFLATVGTAL